MDSIVETTIGKICGTIDGGVHVLPGVRYGATTAGVNCFMPPQWPQEWLGIADAKQNGASAPQLR